jgi:hypothetical protein
LPKIPFFVRFVSTIIARWADLCQHGSNEGTCPHCQSGRLVAWSVCDLLVWLHLDRRLWRRCKRPGRMKRLPTDKELLWFLGPTTHFTDESEQRCDLARRRHVAQDRRGWLGPFRIGIGATWSASDAKWRRLRHAKQDCRHLAPFISLDSTTTASIYKKSLFGHLH